MMTSDPTGQAHQAIARPAHGDDTRQQYRQLRARAAQARGGRDHALAKRLYIQALALDDHDAQVHLELGAVLMALAERLEALPHLQKAARELDRADVRAFYAEALSKIRFGRTDPALKHDVMTGINDTWCRPADLAGVAMSLLGQEYTISAGSAAQMVQSGGALVADPLLHALLRNTPNTDPGLEQWIASARAALLAHAVRDGHVAPACVLCFACTLAMQAWISEYVLDTSDDELAQADIVSDRLCAVVAAGGKPDAFCLAVLACYRPLSGTPMANGLLLLDLSPDLNRLLGWHVRNPLRERALAQQLPCLSPIENEVSKLVRGQYEQNPYPRWITAPTNSGRLPLAMYFSTLFPSFRNAFQQDAHGPAQVLVAGCGTGQQPIGTAATIDNVEVLAVDISLASLAYAKRMAIDFNIPNIKFMHADILALGALSERFDLVECGGVLHHLGDPELGWRILAGLLKPRGVMVIALYSRAARRVLDPARSVIKERQIPSTDAGIRHFRSYIQALPDGDPRKAPASIRDFYTTSMLRDLVFHVNEHEYDLEQIQAMADRLGLYLINIAVQTEIGRQFDAFHGGRRAQNDLGAWNEFEREHPATFMGMYQMHFGKLA